jgi:mersacidin/lichenicidin family type 2 lantibiotic
MKLDIIRAWKDESYRQQLNNEQLPENPAGALELTNSELEVVSGGGFGGFGGLGGFGGFGGERINSFAKLCDYVAFSANTLGQLNFLSPVANICFINN